MNKNFLPWLVLAREKKALVSLVAFGSARNVQQGLGHLEPVSVSSSLRTQPTDDLGLDQPYKGPDTHEMGDVVVNSLEVVPPGLLLLKEEDLQEPFKSKSST